MAFRESSAKSLLIDGISASRRDDELICPRDNEDDYIQRGNSSKIDKSRNESAERRGGEKKITDISLRRFF